MPRTKTTTDRRAQIVDAMIQVMASHGYDGASVADIARKAKLAPGLVHYHFTSKLEILVEAVRAIGARHEAVLAEKLDAEAAPAAQLAAFLDVHLGVGKHADPDLLACWVQVLGEALRDKRVRAEVERVLERLVLRATAIIERGVTARVFTCASPRAAAAALVATIQGYFSVAATARDVVPSGSAAPNALAMAAALVGAPLAKSKRRSST